MANKLGDVKILLSLDDRLFKRQLRSTERSFKTYGKNLTSIGRSLTMNLTMPIGAAAIASAKLAAELETNFAKIENLVGITGKPLAEMKSGLKDISDIVGKSQGELSRGLFVITSAGIWDSANALEILEQSAKASAIGMGDTADIARAATAAVQAYGAESLSASKAVDILTATVKYGNLETQSLAPTIGRVLGLGAELGITFQELGANIAAFTRIGVNAEEAITGLRGVMNQITKGGKPMDDALQSIGWSLAGLKESISDPQRGLAFSLVQLVKQFEAHGRPASDMFTNVRALANVLGVANKQAESYIMIAKGMHNETGIVNKGFENVSKTVQFQFNVALTQLKNLGIEIGEILMPYTLKFIATVTVLIRRFKDLSPAQKDIAVKTAGIVALLPPVIWGFGKLALGISKVLKWSKPLIPFLSKMTGRFGGLSKAGTALVGKFTIVTYIINGVRENLMEMGVTVETVKGILNSNFMQGFVDGLKDGFNWVNKILTHLRLLIEFILRVPNHIATLGTEWKKLLKEQNKLWDGVDYGVRQENDVFQGLFDDVRLVSGKSGSTIAEEATQSIGDAVKEEYEKLEVLVSESLKKLMGDGGDGDGVELSLFEKFKSILPDDIKKLHEWATSLESPFKGMALSWVDSISNEYVEGLFETKLMKKLGRSAKTIIKKLPEISGYSLLGLKGGENKVDGSDMKVELPKKQEYDFWEKIADYIYEWQDALKMVGQIANNVGQIFSNIWQGRIEAIEKSYKTEIDGIRKTTMSQTAKEALITKLEEEREQKTLEIKRRQAKIDKAMGIFQAVIGTAVSVASAKTIFEKIAFAALGAAQIGVIASQPMPLAEGGIIPSGYPNDTYPAMLSSGEAVIPIEKLKGMIGGMQQSVAVYGELHGTDLRLVQDRTDRRYSRVYGK